MGAAGARGATPAEKIPGTKFRSSRGSKRGPNGAGVWGGGSTVDDQGAGDLLPVHGPRGAGELQAALGGPRLSPWNGQGRLGWVWPRKMTRGQISKLTGVGGGVRMPGGGGVEPRMLRRSFFHALTVIAVGVLSPVRSASARLRRLRLQRLEWPGRSELWRHLPEPERIDGSGFGKGAVVHRVTRVFGPAKAPRTDAAGWASYERAMIRARCGAPSKTGRTLP